MKHPHWLPWQALLTQLTGATKNAPTNSSPTGATRADTITTENWLKEGWGGCGSSVANLHKHPVSKDKDGPSARDAYKRELHCWSYLPIDLEDAPQNPPVGYRIVWTDGDIDKDGEAMRVRFGVIEEADRIKIDYLEIDRQTDQIPIPG